MTAATRMAVSASSFPFRYYDSDSAGCAVHASFVSVLDYCCAAA